MLLPSFCSYSMFLRCGIFSFNLSSLVFSIILSFFNLSPLWFWQLSVHTPLSYQLQSPVHTTPAAGRRNLKNALSLKMLERFSVYTILGDFFKKNITINCQVGFSCVQFLEENSSREITWLSRRRCFLKLSFENVFCPHENEKPEKQAFSHSSS